MNKWAFRIEMALCWFLGLILLAYIASVIYIDIRDRPAVRSTESPP